MSETRYTVYAENKAGTNNKFYEVEAIEHEKDRSEWIFRWGRIGTKGQEKSGYCSLFWIAKQKCEEQIKKKQGRGYREVSPLEALASAGEEISDRKRNGLSEVEIVVPCFHAGTSEARCRKFCEKYVAKLNVIRGSFYDLGGSAYEKQIETMLKQYCAEFKRIKGSKSHGHNLVSFADTAARIFFNALKDDAGISVYGYFEGVGA